MKTSGLYVHIPFCRNKCLYCDFYSGGVRIADWQKYIDALLKELELRRGEQQSPLSSIYFGGGTPSLVPAKEFNRLISGIRKYLNIYDRLEEVTIEVNPEDVSESNCLNWKKNGVNRVSVGLQSLNDNELRKIGRRHNARSGIDAVLMLKQYFKNISVDIMFGIPGQTTKSYINTLHQILNMGIQHISSYSLMLEEGTAMTLLEKKGHVILPSEEEWIKMFDLTHAILKEGGYSHYEISNYALPGYESVHNTSYWRGHPYLGLGPGAHSYDGNRIRRENPCDLKSYMDFYSKGKSDSLFYNQEILSEEELREEYILTRMRTSAGIDMEEYRKRFGDKAEEVLHDKIKRFLAEGMMKESEGKFHIAENYIRISDALIGALI